MADFAPLKSAEFTSFSATPRTLIPSYKWGGKLRASSASLTFTAAGATGTAKIIRLPAGKLRVITDLCRIFTAQAGSTNSDLHVGYAAHVSGTTGLAVIADDNAFADNLDVGGAALDAAFSLPAAGYFDFDSADGVDIEVMIDTAAGPATGEMWVLVVYTQGN